MPIVFPREGHVFSSSYAYLQTYIGRAVNEFKIWKKIVQKLFPNSGKKILKHYPNTQKCEAILEGITQEKSSSFNISEFISNILINITPFYCYYCYTLTLPHSFHHITSISFLLFMPTLFYNITNQLSHQSPCSTSALGFGVNLLWYIVRQRYIDCTQGWCSYHGFFSLNLLQIFQNWL